MRETPAVFLFGLGSIGSNVGFNLQASNINLPLYTLDCDKVAQRNLSTQIYAAHSINSFKTDAFSMEVALRLGTRVKRSFNLQFTSTTAAKNQQLQDVFKASNLIIDCFDNYLSRDYVHTAAQNFSKPIVHLGFGIVDTQFVGSVLWQNSFECGQTEIPTHDICNLNDAVWWIKGASALFTRNILNFLHNGTQQNIFVRPDLTVKPM